MGDKKRRIPDDEDTGDTAEQLPLDLVIQEQDEDDPAYIYDSWPHDQELDFNEELP